MNTGRSKNTFLNVCLMTGLILLALLIIPAIPLHRGNVIGMPASLAWSVGGIIFAASFVLFAAIAGSSRIDKFAGGVVKQQVSDSRIRKYSFLGALAGISAIAGYWNTIVTVDFFNRTPHKEIAIVSSVKEQSRVCDYEIQVSMNGSTSSICAHYPFSTYRLRAISRLAPGDKVELKGRKSWAGFAVDTISPISELGE